MGLSGLKQACRGDRRRNTSLSAPPTRSALQPTWKTLQKLFNLFSIILVFRAVPKNKGRSPMTSRSRPRPKTKLLAPNNVWVPGATESE